MKIRYRLIIAVVCALMLNLLLSALAYYISNNVVSDAGPYITVAIEFIMIFPLTVFIDYFLISTVMKPLKKLSKDIEAYKAGGRTEISEYDDGEIGDIQKSFMELSCRLDEEKKKQNRIIASISHDIKTPLTSVMGYTELLRNPNLTPERREKYVNTIYAKAREIQDIVEEFDDYLSCELDDEDDMQYLSLRELTERLVQQAVSEFPTEQLSVNTVCTTDGYLLCDETKLRRVFMNIVTNSVSHGKAEHTEISVYVTRQGEYAVFAFTDNGCGVDKNELKKIFEPMYTTDKSRSVAGLGLAICKEIIEHHKGEIYAKSEKGKYFSVIIKLKTVEKPDHGNTENT